MLWLGFGLCGAESLTAIVAVDVPTAAVVGTDEPSFPESPLPDLPMAIRVACLARVGLPVHKSFSWSLESMLVMLFLFGVPGRDEVLDGLFGPPGPS